MQRIFLSRQGHLRNGWWILIFIALFLLSRQLYTPLVRTLKDAGASSWLLEPMRLLFVLAVTAICLALRRERFANVGLGLNRRWVWHAGIGSVLGVASAALAVALVSLCGGVQLTLDPARSLDALADGVCVFALVAMFEEVLFRGFVFQRLIDGAGVTLAQLLLAALFATSHWGNPEMQGMTLIVASVELFLGALLLGMAYVRTRSLALPIGLHLGWNWAVGPLFGFPVSGFEHAGWFAPHLQEAPLWLTGGGFGLEATIGAIAVDGLLLFALWRWRPGVAKSAQVDASDPHIQRA
jgi:membrane protease YdiL (CAAX protease family)